MFGGGGGCGCGGHQNHKNLGKKKLPSSHSDCIPSPYIAVASTVCAFLSWFFMASSRLFAQFPVGDVVCDCRAFPLFPSWSLPVPRGHLSLIVVVQNLTDNAKITCVTSKVNLLSPIVSKVYYRSIESIGLVTSMIKRCLFGIDC